MIQKGRFPSLHKPAMGQWHVRVRLVMRGDIGIAESAQQVFLRRAKFFTNEILTGAAAFAPQFSNAE
ncbi:hypothetical protein [Parvibaculum sp.]|uniref:hypothetical protein n=1 Tax=Parvibaculum sp. TaxID=2024848 RepID=UPI00391C6580